MDLTIGSLNFRVGSRGSSRLSGSTLSGLSVHVAASPRSSSSIGSSSKVNHPIVDNETIHDASS
jgi:hypothetical protein